MIVHSGHTFEHFTGTIPLSISQETDPLRSVNVEAEKQNERRRSGRPEIVSPNLLPLLRNPALAEEMPGELVIISQAALGAPKGIMIGLLFVAPIWTTLAIAAYYVF